MVWYDICNLDNGTAHFFVKERNMKTERQRSRRWLKWALLAVIPLLAIGAFFILNAAKGKSETKQPQYITYRVESVAYSSVIEVSGNLEPVETEDIGFAASGKVAAVYVKEGDFVKSGALIAKLDDSKERYDLATLDYSIEKAEISGSKSELALLQLEKEMKLAELEEKKVWTTISGVVSDVDVRVGEYVKTGDEIDPIVRIIDLSAMRAEVEIDELDVPRVTLGQKVRFFIDALPNLEITGRVSSLPLEGRVTNEGIAVLDAEVMIDNPPKELLPGYSFAAEIVVSEEEKVLVLDEKAVIEHNGKTVVLLAPAKEGERPTPREVKTSSFENGKVRILSGLSEGDTVVAINSKASAGGGQQQPSSNPLSILGFPDRGPGMRPPGGAQSGRGEPR
jgi:membrane fusion protein (multidrug efflux system)